MRIMVYCKNVYLNLAKAWGIIMLFFVPALGLLIFYPSLIPHLSHIVSQHGFICTVFRWLTIIAIYYTGCIVARKLGRRGVWSLERIEHWRKTRNILMACFIFFEFILIGERLIPILLNCWKS